MWHTQGSGKSLTILFAARKLWNLLNQPTVIIVLDREQLQDQMVKQFVQTNTQNCRVAEGKDDLLSLLRDGDGYRGIILTIMHKFDWRDAVEIKRSDVVMLVDEAHRTQYGQIAIDMRKLLPNASMFGFTGTPLELDDRNTPVAFGQEQGKDVAGHEIFERYMDRYSIADALRDRATVPIRWQARMTDWKVWGKALDEQFEELFAHLSPGERNALKTQEAKLDRILKHPERIAQIAADVAEHFKQHVQRNGFKAMLACHDKETCVLYKAALDTLLGPEVSLCIYSESPKEDSDPKLAEEVVRLTEERKMPLRDQIAKAAWERNPDAKAGQADDVADAILAKADEFCFPNWFQKDDVDTTLYREFIIMLAGKFGNPGLHGRGKDFVDRCIKLLKRARYVGEGPKGDS